MAEKKILLEKLRNRIQLGEEFAVEQYVEEYNGRVCYCAVGHLLKDCGIDLTDLKEDYFINSRRIDSNDLTQYAKPLLDVGFELDELRKIQSLNDGAYTEDLEQYIGSLLEPLV